MIQIKYCHNTVVITLAHGITNALSPELVTALTTCLKKVTNDSCITGVVLSSSNDKFFSIGLDIPQLYDFDKKEFYAFYHAFNRMCITLYTLPKPTVAAVTGHAVAGGCILALCCDYRFIAEGRRLMGLNEIKLGVPVPYPADCILQHMGVGTARDIMCTGAFYLPEQLAEMGVVDQVLPLTDVLPKAIEKAQTLGALPQKAYALIKRGRVEGVEQQILNRLTEKEQLFLGCWFSDEARTRLKKAMEKF